MNQPPPHPDDLRDARAADRLNTWLDGSSNHRLAGPPDLGPIAAAIDRLSRTGLPDTAIRRHEDTLWETLMRPQTSTAPAVVTSPVISGQSDPVAIRPSPARRSSSRVMGLVATLTLVVLISLSAVAVYLSSPRPGDEPELTLAAVGAASPTARIEPVPTQARADATRVVDDPPIWTLPAVTAYDLPTLEILGSGWNPLVGSHYLFTLDGTDVQAEAHTYVDNRGNRVRTVVAYFPEYGSIDTAREWAQREIGTSQDSLYPRGADPESGRRDGRLDGCETVTRTEGLELITSFYSFATGCLSDDGRVMVLVTVSGNIIVPDSAYPRNPADGIVTAILEATEAPATPVAGR